MFFQLIPCFNFNIDILFLEHAWHMCDQSQAKDMELHEVEWLTCEHIIYER